MTRPFFLLLVVVALLPVACGSQPSRSVSSTAAAGRPVIFVGLDGADWQLLDDYIAASPLDRITGKAPPFFVSVSQYEGGT